MARRRYNKSRQQLSGEGVLVFPVISKLIHDEDCRVVHVDICRHICLPLRLPRAVYPRSGDPTATATSSTVAKSTRCTSAATAAASSSVRHAAGVAGGTASAAISASCSTSSATASRFLRLHDPDRTGAFGRGVVHRRVIRSGSTASPEAAGFHLSQLRRYDQLVEAF